MIAYYKTVNMSLDKNVKRLDHRIIVKNGNTEIGLDENSAYELRSSLTSAIISMETAKRQEEE